MKHLFWLSDAARAAIDAHLPHGQPDKPRVDDRRDVPAAYGPPTTIYNRFNRWSRRGIWQRMFEAVAATGAVPPELSLDSTHVKAHCSAAGAKGGVEPGDRPLARRAHLEDPLPGRSWRPTGRVRPDTGQRGRHQHGPAAAGSERRIKAVIPSTASRTVPDPLDRRAYRRRNHVERLFCRLKNWRRIATRYDRLARNYLASLAPVAIAGEWT